MDSLTSYDKNFRPMAVADLLAVGAPWPGGLHFVIPSFQRGYRWEPRQVTDLLEDIDQFANDPAGQGDSYFLQPVVVKKLPTPPGQEGEYYEVLDGQQRLTTLLLVLKRLMRRLSQDERETFEPGLYDIRYTNRPQLDFDNPDPADNPDSFYLAEAKEVIDSWFKAQMARKHNLTPFADSLLYDKRQVKIIWYAVDPSGADLLSIGIFNRLNKGKISLTSSELIKALFIMDYDTRAKGDFLPGERLAMEWNEMEKRLQDDSFWYFLSDTGSGVQTRIDLLFDFVTGKDADADTDYSYRQFQKLYDHCRQQERGATAEKGLFDAPWARGINTMEDAWREVRRVFDRLVAWYEDSLYYHYVGFLVAADPDNTPLKVYNYLEAEKKKLPLREPGREWTVDDTCQALRRLMMESFKEANRYKTKADIDELEYNNATLARRLLLLFNVESYRTAGNARFPFDSYKKEHWDLEHIDSQNEATAQSREDRLSWLQNVRFILLREATDEARALADRTMPMIERFQGGLTVDKKAYTALYTDVNRHFSREAGQKDSEVDLAALRKDNISNLTLLDEHTNRGYQDAPFPYKRHCIVQKDRQGRTFIPMATRNVFLKYYTDSNAEASHLDVMRWGKADRLCYLRAIHEVVDPVFDSITDQQP